MSRERGLVARALAWAVCAAAVAGCAVAAQPGSGAVGNPNNGQRIYNGDVPVRGARGDIMPCARCHPVREGEKPNFPVGINLYGLADRAGVMVPGKDAQAYLRESILDPDAYLAGNFQDGLMSREYPTALTRQQVDDLVAYLLTLKAAR